MQPRAASGPPLLVSGVTKCYGSFCALRDVSLTVREGEIFALLGPNGAGKTTLIHCITGLARQTAGDISVFGRDTVREFRTTRRLVGLVPQEINFDPFFTPMESLLIQMGLMGLRRDRAHAAALLDLFSLGDRQNAYTRTLSGGMKRRLLIAKALVHRPRLLFLDEPTAGVDVALRRDLWRVVRALRDEGTTIILTTHYLEEAEALADRVGVIHQGRLRLVEERAALLARFRERRVVVRFARPFTALPDGFPDGARLHEGAVTAPFVTPADLERVLVQARAVGEPADVAVTETRLEDIFLALIDNAGADATAGGNRGV